MSRGRLLLALAIVPVLIAGTVFVAPGLARFMDPAFPHEKHATLFPLCTSCHTGVTEAGRPMWPEQAQCASCHDGVVKARVEWAPRDGPRATNLRFTHEAHHRAAIAKNPADSTLVRRCSSCHVQTGEHRMQVRHAVVPQCLSCHGFTAPHVDNPGTTCATCHLTLTDAVTLTAADIRDFPRPRSHDAQDFLLGGHGRLARIPGSHPGTPVIASSCATCHARNLCSSCHVNAPENPVIRALAFDDRAPAYTSRQLEPANHTRADFLSSHGRDAARSGASCATCHTGESCMTCHARNVPRAVAELPHASSNRPRGAQTTRTPPPTHTREFRERHGADASARPRSCETCHERSTCLECHRPDGGRQWRYHPQNFLTRHPSSAYSREATCSDCHNPAQFCQGCHQQAGLVATSRIGTRGYHDAFRGFSLGHGQAARQSLESCASCHAERDCTACHSAVGAGFRFSPHGPGFNAARMRAKNPSLCAACHGNAIPGGD